MSEFLTFEGRIVPMEWGTSVYTVLPIPAEVDALLRAQGAVRVEGEVGEHPVNLALTRAPVIETSFLYTGKAFLKASGLVPGDLIEVRLRPAPENHVDTPDDLAAALRSAERTEAWAALSPGKRRGLLHQVDTARRAETRAKRIAKLIADLA